MRDIRLGILALAVMAAASPSPAGVWTRIGPEALSFSGKIEPGEHDRFALVFGPAIREIVVDSPGGVTEEGIRIGHAIASRHIKIVVTGECLSSCANYLFTAGHERELRRGVVGFHGNVKACFTGERQAEMIDRMRREFGMSEEDIRRELERQDREVAEEARLLRVMGVSQELFDRTCTDDKGMGDGRQYAFLLPKRGTFERYGLWGIVGEQDPAVMSSLPFPFAFD